MLPLDAQEGNERKETQTRGCFAQRYLWGLVLLGKSEEFRVIRTTLAAALAVIPTLSHQTPAEQSWRLWQSPALQEHAFESHGRKPSLSLCRPVTSFPVPEQQKDGEKKREQLVGRETKRKLSGQCGWDRVARSEAKGQWFQCLKATHLMWGVSIASDTFSTTPDPWQKVSSPALIGVVFSAFF